MDCHPEGQLGAPDAAAPDQLTLGIEAKHGSLAIYFVDSSSDSLRSYSLLAQSYSNSSRQKTGELTAVLYII